MTAAALSLAAAPIAAAPAAAAAGTATVTIVHGIPDTPVDVYANGKKILSGFTFKTVTSPLSLPAGSYAIAGYATTRPPGHDFGTVPAATVTAGPAGRTAPARHGHAGPAGIAVTAIPVRLRIAAIGVNAPVVPVGVAADGTLGIPASPSVLGWWADGGSPGQASGATVLVGHVDSAARGPGALFRLQQLRPGAAVAVTAGGRAWRFVVRAVRAYAKTGLPSAAVFGQRVTPRLVIITCGGPFDAATGHYLDNIVVYAVPV